MSAEELIEVILAVIGLMLYMAYYFSFSDSERQQDVIGTFMLVLVAIAFVLGAVYFMLRFF